MSFVVLMRPARDGVEKKDAGKLVTAGPSWVGDDPFGIGIFALRDRAEVEAIVAADPAVTSGWLTPEIRPMTIIVE